VSLEEFEEFLHKLGVSCSRDDACKTKAMKNVMNSWDTKRDMMVKFPIYVLNALLFTSRLQKME
jgi:hypothetical protein